MSSDLIIGMAGGVPNVQPLSAELYPVAVSEPAICGNQRLYCRIAAMGHHRHFQSMLHLRQRTNVVGVSMRHQYGDRTAARQQF